MALRIAISGATGAGKTTLATELGRAPGAGLVAEPQPKGLLDRFSREPRAHCAALQEAIISGRAEAARRAAPARVHVLDRTVREDLEVFVAMHAARGYLTPDDVARLAGLAARAEASIGAPDLFVLVTADPAALAARLEREGAPVPILASLDDQLARYRAWWARCRTRRLELDTTRRAPGEYARIAAWILATAEAPAPAHDPELGLRWIEEDPTHVR